MVGACGGGPEPAEDDFGIPGGATTDDEPAAPQVVPLDLPALEIDASCFVLDAVPAQWSVTPHGALWVRTGSTTWRVLDRFEGDTVQTLPADVSALQALDADRALVIADGQLWDVRAGWPLPLPWPDGLPSPSALCGDPSSDANGFVAAGGLVHRERAQWWSWTGPDGERFADLRWFAHNAGVCLADDRGLWFAVEGEAWRLTPEFAARVELLDDAEMVVLVDRVGAAARIEGDLVVGDLAGFDRFRFEAGDVELISAGADVLWVAAGLVLYRMHEGELMPVQLDGESVRPTHIVAESGGGIWTLDADVACHLRPAPPVELHGVYNLQRRSAQATELAITVHPDAELTSVSLDGSPLEPWRDADRWYVDVPRLDAGWHEIEVAVVDAAEQLHDHRVRFEQLSGGELTWHAHIEPLVAEHCAGCHGPTAEGRVDLTSWDAWLQYEAAIRTRVLINESMPPLAARTDDWGLEAMQLVRDWFDTGAAKGEP